MSNIAQLATAFRLYAAHNEGSLPATIADLTNSAFAPALYVCPATSHKTGMLQDVSQWTDYVFVGSTSSIKSVLMYCPPSNHKGEGGVVLWKDGTIEWVTSDRFTEDVTNTPTLNNPKPEPTGTRLNKRFR